MKKPIIIIIAVVLVLVVGLGGFFVWSNMQKAKAEKPKEIVYHEFVIDNQYANIKSVTDPEKKSILKYTCSIQYTDEAFLKTIEGKTSELKTEYRKYFMSKNTEQISRLDRVQEDLLELTINILQTTPEIVTNVFLTDFISQ